MDKTRLKLLALLLMTADHVAAFIPGAPGILHMVGRLAAPLFLFCLVDSWDKTVHRDKLMLRLWVMGLVMAVGSRLLAVIANCFGDYFSYPVENNIFISLLSVLVVLWLAEKPKGGWLIAGYFALGAGCWALLAAAAQHNLSIEWSSLLLATATVNPFLSEGGVPFLLLGLLLHRYHPQPKKLALACVGFYAVTALLTALPVVQWLVYPLGALRFPLTDVLRRLLQLPLNPQNLLSVGGCQWMGVLALPLMLCYNGQRGKGIKWFFYAYYPLHIWLLALAGAILA